MNTKSNTYTVSTKRYETRRAELAEVAKEIENDLNIPIDRTDLDYALHSYCAAIRAVVIMGIVHIYVVSIEKEFNRGDEYQLGDSGNITLRIPNQMGTYIANYRGYEVAKDIEHLDGEDVEAYFNRCTRIIQRNTKSWFAMKVNELKDI